MPIPLSRLRALLLSGLTLVCTEAAAGGEPATAVLAGGCYWSFEADLDQVPGVLSTTAGYTTGRPLDGSDPDASVSREAVKLTYDPDVLSYADLLDIFWRSIDPTDAEGQSCDRGTGYTTAIYVYGDEDRRIAEASRRDIEESAALPGPVVTPVFAEGQFRPASASNQEFYLKSPKRYARNRLTCRRDAVIRRVWGSEAFTGIPAS